ncbi:cilia- and flagella-associated protein 157-like [Trichoplusia ni]|uniref:Cilia- and flagella-associated protein 157 n=1 Tax=Trichoplusia ni TaxID=7111 RepID=A0A7E5WW38_TRINI|nr:cilia- and flagella-associated protein 157-like [Trichoplusia ni]
MPPKKEKKKDDEIKGVFSEVEKALYELQLADCNRKVARLRSAVTDYEVRNEELQKAYDKLDEDRADIIAYLKKTLNIKNEENIELKEKVRGLEELREIETAQFKETVTELEKNFTTMKDQLTSENKLLAGKLNTLEEFRAIRDDLMRKFDRQEHSFEEQEMKYKRMLYEAEKKFVIGKDKLKREMEGRLLQLAQEFQDASEMRIAASTHRVIRENIALNNQLDSLLQTQAKVAEQNDKFREDERAARNAKEVAEEERDKAINKSIVQLKVIDQLTAAFQDVKKQKALYDKKQFDNEKLQAKMEKLTTDNENLLLRVRILEQNLHASLGEQNKSVVETAKLLREIEKYKKILKDSAFAVQAALKLDHWSTLDPTREILEREIVLKKILKVINQYRDAFRAESMESLISLSKIYEKGDLGFTPKPVSRRSMLSAGGLLAASLESVEDKRSVGSEKSSSTSLASVKTVPSIELVPVEDQELESPKESLPSFTITSLHSSEQDESEGEEPLEDMNDIEKMLAISKAEMQKSLMRDLAMSQVAMQSQLHLSISDERRKSSHMRITSDKHGEETFKKEKAEDEETGKKEAEDTSKKDAADTGEEQISSDQTEGSNGPSDQSDVSKPEDGEERQGESADSKSGEEKGGTE